MDSNGNEHREAVREVIETEVKNLINEEMRKAAQDLADEQKKAIRQIVEEQKIAINAVVEEEKAIFRESGSFWLQGEVLTKLGREEDGRRSKGGEFTFDQATDNHVVERKSARLELAEHLNACGFVLRKIVAFPVEG